MTTDLVATLEERTAALRAPIAPDKPSGEDVSFGTDFERIERELAKLQSVDGAKPEWDLVDQLASTMLSKQTKDFRLAVWSTVAKANIGRWEGLAEGLVVCRDLARDYWTTMFPDAKRLRGRANLVAWMSEQIVIALDPLEVSRADEDALLACDKLSRELDGLLSDKLGDAHPGRGRVAALFESKIAAIPAPETTKPTEEERPAEVAAAAAPVIMGLVAPESPGDAPEAVTKAFEILLAAANLLFEADPSDPAPYRVRRAFLDVRPAEANRAPTDDERARLAGLEEARDWLALARAGEEAILASPDWLDAHAYTARALTELGSGFQRAREVVEGAARARLARDPSLVNAAFEDGKPYATTATRAWVEQEVRRGMNPPALLAAEDEQNQQGLATARQLIKDGRAADGITVALGVARRGATARSRFLLTLAAAKLALEADRKSLARPILDALAAEIAARRLDEWDPDLCVGVYHTLYTILDDETKKTQLFDILCRLDPSVAFLGRK